MKIRSVFIASGSGSVGGATLSRNKGGMYLRTRSIPTNPNTALQVAVRAALGQMASAWNNVLSQTERDAWNLYASNVTVTNPLGEAIQLSGQQHFIRSNVPRLQAAVPIVTSGPTTFNLGDFTSPTDLTMDPATPEISFEITSTDDWALEAGAHMLVYQGKPKNPGTSFFKGPFRFIGTVPGAATAPSNFSSSTPPYMITSSQVVWLRVQVSRADGRLSQSLILGPTTA